MRSARRAQQDYQRAVKLLRQLNPARTAILLIIRHGETSWNVQHRLQGHLDPGLNERGHAQAMQSAQHFTSRQATLVSGPITPPSDGHLPDASSFCWPQQPVSAVWSSDLGRAVQTARPIADELRLQLHISPLLRERCLGVLQGLTCHEASQLHPDAWSAMTSSDDDDVGGSLRGRLKQYGIESRQELRERVVHGVEKIAELHAGETVIVVLHGGSIHAMLAHATSRHIAPAKNVAMYVVAVQAGKAWVPLETEGLNIVGEGMESKAFGGGQAGG